VTVTFEVVVAVLVTVTFEVVVAVLVTVTVTGGYLILKSTT
jgi:hypothetical protein